MDTVPYEFVDRVFTKLSEKTITEMSNNKLKAPIWREVARVYKEKLKSVSVEIWLDADYVGLVHRIKINHNNLLTLQEFLNLDPRFNRIYRFHCEFGAAGSNMNKTAVDQFLPVLQRVSQFDLIAATIHFPQEPPTVIYNALMESDFSTQQLTVNHFNGAEAFAKKQMERPELKRLIMRAWKATADWSSAGRDLEAFVCRPQFNYLNCGFPCFDTENFKRIVAHWKTNKPTMRWFIQVRTDPDVSSKIGDWMTQDCRHIFSERMGENDFKIYVVSKYCCLTFNKH